MYNVLHMYMYASIWVVWTIWVCVYSIYINPSPQVLKAGHPVSYSSIVCMSCLFVSLNAPPAFYSFASCYKHIHVHVFHTYIHEYNIHSHEIVEKQVDEKEEEKREEEEEESVFLAFARVYSGTLHRGQEVCVLQPRYDPREVNLDGCEIGDNCAPGDGDGATCEGGDGEEEVKYVTKVTVQQLYILMGRGVLEVDSVPAGNVLGIAGLDKHILKSATISTTLACPAFRPTNVIAAPILRVAVEPLNASDMPGLARGMKLLNQADASIEVSVQATGEYILSTAGEVHLQRCIDDLQDTFSKVKLKVSAPIVPFRETIVPPPTVDTLNETISSENVVVKLPPTNPLLSSGEGGVSNGNVITIQTPNKMCTLHIQAQPLPEAVAALLYDNVPLLKALYLTSTATAARSRVKLDPETYKKLQKLRRDLSEGFSISNGVWSEFSEVSDRIWAFGPKSTGTNILLNGLAEYQRGSVWRTLESCGGEGSGMRGYGSSIVYGFQLATLAGPLCEEPLHGVCFILRGWRYAVERPVGEGGGESCNKMTPVADFEGTSSPALEQLADTYGPSSGQLISSMKEGCRRAFLSQPPRLMSAMYTCNILATADVLGRLYAVLGRRNGRVCAEEMREGSTVFSVQAVVPVAESFGFSEEVRKKTSGLASPQLVFSHWEVRRGRE